MVRIWVAAWCAVLLSLPPLSAQAASVANWMHEIGYGLLIDEYGPSLKTGAGLHVTLVESLSGGHYMPAIYQSDGTTLTSQFAGKTFTNRSTFTGGYSSHATTVAAYFFGNHAAGTFSQRSLAPGISNIDIYNAVSWLESGYLRADSSAPPAVSPNLSRVYSHAYLASTSANYVRRVDYLTHTDDALHVVASTGGSGEVTGLGVAFNAIAVGRFDGGNAPNGTASVFAYPAGRHKPDLVVTHGTSDSIGITAGAAALLIDLASDPALSNGAYTLQRTGQPLQHGQSSEVIKAALMAGAMRHVTDVPWTGHAITTYRDTAAHSTANGLDTRYGAGRMNIRNSYKIIEGGEQDSAEDDADAGSTAGHIAAEGFDYDASFGGASASNAAASYRFATLAEGGMLTATLAWNVGIDYDEEGIFDLTATPIFHAMELVLYDITTGQQTLVASSSSAIDNTQSLWLDLIGGREYLLQVRPLAGQDPFEWDYGLAWRIDGWAPAAVPEPVSLMLLGGGMICLTSRYARPTR